MVAWESTQSLVFYSSNMLSPLAVLLPLLVGLVRSCCHVGLANPICVAGDLAVMVICRTERLYRLHLLEMHQCPRVTGMLCRTPKNVLDSLST